MVQVAVDLSLNEADIAQLRAYWYADGQLCQATDYVLDVALRALASQHPEVLSKPLALEVMDGDGPQGL